MDNKVTPSPARSAARFRSSTPLEALKRMGKFFSLMDMESCFKKRGTHETTQAKRLGKASTYHHARLVNCEK
ncbi:hypothetical protein E2C01_054270 [Portunus trituberculatus]|uniref:Uncharacterized protein n=1 Tax=Portunus trituberculatus TaxID=210409 RepID=A0A5B7GJG2_PORTR|nr:hypothetical protein [Portunus trituberculatus]